MTASQVWIRWDLIGRQLADLQVYKEKHGHVDIRVQRKIEVFMTFAATLDEHVKIQINPTEWS